MRALATVFPHFFVVADFCTAVLYVPILAANTMIVFASVHDSACVIPRLPASPALRETAAASQFVSLAHLST